MRAQCLAFPVYLTLLAMLLAVRTVTPSAGPGKLARQERAYLLLCASGKSRYQRRL
jgi:hypothetical protein